jgi:uncharacterized caspase-like protein
MSRKLALIIGNSQYEDAGLARLSAPDADVHALADVLRDASIGAFDAVESIVDQSFAHTRRAIARFFDERKRDDLLLLYFSGHGVRDEYGHLHLAVRDTERSLLAATAIEAAFVSECMDRSASKRLVLVLDCCHSGAFGYGAKSAYGASVGTAVAFEGTGRGRVVLTATDATQYAWEGETIVGEARPSVFTRHVTEGLRTGAADLDGDGIVTVDELYEYVYEQVLNDTAKQTPGKWAFGQQGDIVIARNPAAAAAARDGASKVPPVVWGMTPRLRQDESAAGIAPRLGATIEALTARLRHPAGIVAILSTAAVLAIVAFSGRPQPSPEPNANAPQAQRDVPLQTVSAVADSTPAVADSTPAPPVEPDAGTTKPPSNTVPPSNGRTASARPAGGAPPPQPTGGAASPRSAGGPAAAMSNSAGSTSGIRNTTPLEPTTPGPAEATVNPRPATEPSNNGVLAGAPPARSTTPAPSAESQIDSVLERYTKARGEKDLDTLSEIWPSVPAVRMRKAYLGIAAETVKLTKCTKGVTQGVTAEVECDEQVSSTFTSGTRDTQLSRAKFLFRREGDHWLIAQIARRPL